MHLIIYDEFSFFEDDFQFAYSFSKGVLTPDEFVCAGDHLVSTCPTWKWGSGENDKLKPYLPKDKQFLITKSVPCHRRCKDIEYNNAFEKLVDDEDGDGGN